MTALVIAVWLALDQTQQEERLAERLDEPSAAVAVAVLKRPES